MGIINKLLMALTRGHPKNSLAGDEYAFNMGYSTSGQRVTVTTAMRLAAVYACVRILSESLAQLPLHLYRYTSEGGKEKAVDHPLYLLLHEQPNPEMTSFVFRETLMSHLLLWGNAYAQIIRNGKGDVTAIYPLMASRMKVDRDKSQKIIYQYSHGNDEAKTMKDDTITLKSDSVFHIPGLGFDGVIGYSPIAMAKNAIGLGLACDEYGSKFFVNGATPSGVLEHPGVIKDANKVRETWRSTFSGSQNAHKIAVLEEGMKYAPIGISPEQAQFLETRKFQLNEIARIFRVPPHMIGDLERSSYNNMEQQSLEFVKFTVEPWAIRWEQGLAKALLKPEERGKYFFKFNFEGLLRGDYESRMKGYSIGVQNGFMSPNDVRDLESLDLIPEDEGGNLYMVNGNMLPLKQAGAAYRAWYEEDKDPDEESDNPKKKPEEDGDDKDNDDTKTNVIKKNIMEVKNAQILELANGEDKGAKPRNKSDGRNNRASPDN